MAKAKPASAEGGVIFTLRIDLIEVEPPIWRRIRVHGAIKLPRLSRVIQYVFGWQGYHLHQFEFGGKVRKTGVLQDLLADGTSDFVYRYDFGDDWEHRIVVEDRTVTSAADGATIFLDGERAAPLEDCGGPWAYEELLEILADPSHELYQEKKEWMDYLGYTDEQPFQPEALPDDIKPGGMIRIR